MIDRLHTLHASAQTQNPLILNLTNVVTMDFVANVQLALGASPIMSIDEREIHELVHIADAIYINLGTLNPLFEDRVAQALEVARAQNKKIILDPVGCGASQVRTSLSAQVASKAHLIRGNANEIIALASAMNPQLHLSERIPQTRGVDATTSSDKACYAAQTLLSDTTRYVAISGAHDHLVTAQQTSSCHFGTKLMTQVTGMGCALGGALSVAVALESTHATAIEDMINLYALSGQQCAQQGLRSQNYGPGTFKSDFIDALYAPGWDAFQEAMRETRS